MKNKGQFKKGYTPYNKGIKRGSVSPRTEFKEGVHAPAFRGYGIPRIMRKGNVLTTIEEQISVVDNRTGKIYLTRKRISYARYLWIKNHGKIPKGMIIYNSSKDLNNIKIENLKLMSRAELMILNKEEKE